MKYWFFSLFMCLVINCFAQRTIAESEDLRFQAQIKQDTLALQKLVADELVYIHSNALTETKADLLHTVTSGSIDYQIMEPEGERTIRQYGKTGVSNGIVHVSGMVNGSPFDIRLRYTAVYHKQKKIWRLVSWQSTKVP